MAKEVQFNDCHVTGNDGQGIRLAFDIGDAGRATNSIFNAGPIDSPIIAISPSNVTGTQIRSILPAVAFMDRAGGMWDTGSSHTCNDQLTVVAGSVAAAAWVAQAFVPVLDAIVQVQARIFENGDACDVVCATDCGFAHDSYEPVGLSPVSATHFEEVEELEEERETLTGQADLRWWQDNPLIKMGITKVLHLL
ncbi:hypothetical protein AK812_SmicGene29757 [Symbiodinium microadriaticum]|uniref:Uncharacterized protein n=1 Tax=Symbiodinium microadriaticum TaxID=2951 RepID=A0A1Q9D112_SYMMI|nr:hypothetical protein AK812_SmicGene29757 [Symbiodinium microadriaticum]